MILHILALLCFSCVATLAQEVGGTDGVEKPAGASPSDQALTDNLLIVFNKLRTRNRIGPLLNKEPLIQMSTVCCDRLRNAGLTPGDPDTPHHIRRCQSAEGKDELTYWHTSNSTNVSIILGEIEDSWTKRQLLSYFNKYVTNPKPEHRTYEEDEKEFTQVMWAGTEYVGCATLSLEIAGSVTACTFSPAGNGIVGRRERNDLFLKNVPYLYPNFSRNVTDSET